MPRIHICTLVLLVVSALHLLVLFQLGFDLVKKVVSGAQPAPALLRRLEQQWSPSDAPTSPIHLVFTSSATYNIGLLALVNSTLVNAAPTTLPRLQFHVVSSNNHEASQVVDRLLHRFGDSIADRLFAYGLEEMNDTRLEGVKVWAGYRAESLSKPIVFARYLLPALLPAIISRAIYLDQDVLVLKDLAPLWDIDLQGRPLAAARLCRPSALWRKQFVMNKPALSSSGFDHDTCTLNNGVIVYDLDAWRTSSPSYTDELFEWTRKNSEDKLYSLGSQPPFNLVFYRNYKILDDDWNLMDLAGLREDTEYGAGLPTTRSREEVESAAILHWNGVMKPWSCDGEGYYSELWIRYLPDYTKLLEDEAEDPAICRAGIVTTLPVSASVEKFTVVIVSFARVDTIVKIVRHLQHSAYLHEIVIAWNNQEHPCPPEVVEFPWVRCLQQKANLVHNRFLIWPEIKTEAVLHYDDDLLAPIEDLDSAFQLWRHHRSSILGFEPRVIVCDGDAERQLVEQDSSHGVVNDAGLPSIASVTHYEVPQNCRYKFKLPDGYFDVVIGKLFMVSRSHMKDYFTNRALVTLSSDAPCEDIGMNFLVANSASPTSPPLPPLLFKSNLTELHSNVFAGLSQGIASDVWRNKRHECVQRLMEIFSGRRPGSQKSFYERDPVRRRVYKLEVQDRLATGWCSDTLGSRVCRQP